METKMLLQEYYSISSENIPQQREKSLWKPENNFGFLLGIIAYGIDTHITKLHSLLVSRDFDNQEQAFIDSMFDYYIRPFHKNYDNNSESCASSSSIPSRASSTEDLDYVPEETELFHKDLKKAVFKRDGVCLFCWDKLDCEAAHIIAKKNIPMANDENSLLQRASLTHKHQVQNRLLLCIKCHSQFGKLKRYVDFVEDKFVVKVVNDQSDEYDVKDKDWEFAINFLQSNRRTGQKYISDDRQAVETNGEMALYFVQNNPTKLPNREALEFHKTACLIWRMAGGAEIDQEYCSDDDDWAPVDTAALKRRFKIQDSEETLDRF